MTSIVKGVLAFALVAGGMFGVYMKIEYSVWVIVLGGVCVLSLAQD